jgi:hypothetical protein
MFQSNERVHPARLELLRRGLTIKGTAAALGYDPDYLSRVLGRRLPASARLRAQLADFLRLPEGELFVLDRPHAPRGRRCSSRTVART